LINHNGGPTCVLHLSPKKVLDRHLPHGSCFCSAMIHQTEKPIGSKADLSPIHGWDPTDGHYWAGVAEKFSYFLLPHPGSGRGTSLNLEPHHSLVKEHFAALRRRSSRRTRVSQPIKNGGGLIRVLLKLLFVSICSGHRLIQRPFRQGLAVSKQVKCGWKSIRPHSYGFFVSAQYYAAFHVQVRGSIGSVSVASRRSREKFLFGRFATVFQVALGNLADVRCFANR
jgi:hypothetical protein